MQTSHSTPSVLAQPLDSTSPVSMDGFGSTLPEGSSPTRRQRISMACQYCRHRKIRCCGGAPCRNCSRSQRECEYAPVPEEINRATREKKAVAKASKSYSPAPTYSPYFVDTPVYDVPYVSGPPAHMRTHFGHRRSVSTPNFDVPSWVPPPSAPALHSPPMFENPHWMYNGWSAPSVEPVVPSVLQQQQTPNPRPEVDQWTRPQLTPLTTYTPHTPCYTPFPTPPLFQAPVYSSSPLAHQISPTLAPEMAMHKDLVGLGIGMPSEAQDVFQTPTTGSEEYFVNHF